MQEPGGAMLRRSKFTGRVSLAVFVATWLLAVLASADVASWDSSPLAGLFIALAIIAAGAALGTVLALAAMIMANRHDALNLICLLLNGVPLLAVLWFWQQVLS